MRIRRPEDRQIRFKHGKFEVDFSYFIEPSTATVNLKDIWLDDECTDEELQEIKLECIKLI